MKKIDITKNIKELYQAEIMDELQAEVVSELKEKIPQQLKDELALLLGQSKSNVVTFVPKDSFKQSFDSVELLAAAGIDAHDWFASPIYFPKFGFTLDIRTVLGSEAEVELTLLIDKSNPQIMSKSLSAYKDQTIKILIQNNDIDLLKGELYIDSSAEAASGSGELLNVNEKINIKNKLMINILE